MTNALALTITLLGVTALAAAVRRLVSGASNLVSAVTELVTKVVCAPPAIRAARKRANADEQHASVEAMEAMSRREETELAVEEARITRARRWEELARAGDAHWLERRAAPAPRLSATRRRPSAVD